MDPTLNLDIYNQGVSHGIEWMERHSGVRLHIDHDNGETLRVVTSEGGYMGIPRRDPFGLGVWDAFQNAGIIEWVQ